MDPVDDIAKKIDQGESLTDDEIDKLAEEVDLLALGALADRRRRFVHGDRASFVRVVEVPAGISKEDELPFVPPGAGEVRICGHPGQRESVVAVTTRIHRAKPKVPLTGFELYDLVDVCRSDAGRVRELLESIKDAGMGMISEVCLNRMENPMWVELAETVGVPVGRLTVTQPLEQSVATMRRVASWNGLFSNVKAFAPLPSTLAQRRSTGYDDVRQVALARLVVDNIESVQIDWGTHGPKLAQLALTFGANDFDSVSPVDSIEQGWRRAPLEEITRNITAASFVPVERNGHFEIGTVRP